MERTRLGQSKRAKEVTKLGGTGCGEPSTYSLDAFGAELWVGLATGILAVTVLAYQRFVVHQVLRLGLPAAWMSPVSNVFLLLLPGLVRFLAARVWRVQNIPRSGIFFLTLLSVFGLLQYVTALHLVSKLALAIGLAAVFTRIVRSHTEFFVYVVSCHQKGGDKIPELWRQSRKSFPVLALGVAAIAGLVHGWQHFTEQKAVSSLPIASPGAPNIYCSADLARPALQHDVTALSIKGDPKIDDLT